MAGTGLSRDGQRESAAWFDPFPLSRGLLHDANVPRRGARRRHTSARRCRTDPARRRCGPDASRSSRTGPQIDAPILRAAMETAFGGSDADGAWDWKLAYDACEAATVLFLRKYGKALLRKAGSPAAALPLLAKIADLLPTHTRRSEESQAFQQFSTPIPLGLCRRHRGRDHAAGSRAGTLGRHRAARHPRRDRRRQRSCSTSWPRPARIFSPPSFRPSPSPASTRRRSTIISTPTSCPASSSMNPPFSAMANVDRAAWPTPPIAMSPRRWRACADGGRLVAITGASFAPDTPTWRDAFVRLQERGRVVFTAAIDGRSMRGTARPSTRG